MAKVEMEDGTVISSSHLADMMDCGYPKNHRVYTPVRVFFDITKLKIPSGRHNRDRLENINMYDLLMHMQEILLLSNKCILELITNESHPCVGVSDEDVRRRIRQFAEQFITDDLKKTYPQHFKKDGHDYDESDEDYICRLCHIIMYYEYPRKYRIIKCEECLQKWMNSSIW